MSNEADPKRGPASLDIGKLALRTVAVLVVATGVVVAVVAFSHDRVCNQQVTARGNTVEVCRHLEATDPPVIVGALVVLAALGAFFNEISGFGLSLKRDVADAKDAAKSAKEAAASAAQVSRTAKRVAASAKMAAESADSASRKAREVADYAEGAASSAAQAAQVATELSRRSSVDRFGTAPEQQFDPAQEIRMLADDYNATRRAMPSGAERTSAMTSIVAKMISVLDRVEPDQFDVSAYLGDDDPGLRLAGYAYLYSNPDPRRTQEIADSMFKEEKPFAQYWALRALHRQVQDDPTSLDRNTRRRLNELLDRVGRGTDRAYEIREILREGST
jgi:hypothetical protein